MICEESDSMSKMVLSAKNEVIKAVTSSIFKFHSLEKLCEFLPKKGKYISKETDQFMTTFYKEFLIFLLSNFEISWLGKETGGNAFDNMIKDLIFCESEEQALIATCQSLNKIKYKPLQFQKVIIWICNLMEKDYVCRALCKRCQYCPASDALFISDETYKEFLQLLSSLPDVVLGQNKEAVATDLFYQDKYSLLISKQIVATLTFCHKRLSEGHDTCVTPISKLLGKMCMSGYGKILWFHIIDLTSKQLDKNLLWQRVMQKTISNIDEWCIDCTIDPFIFHIKSPQMMSEFLGDLPLKNNKLEHVLIHKFILCRYFTDANIPKIILVYLSSDIHLKILFNKLFVNILKVWRQKTLLKHQPVEQTHYLCQVILICLNLQKKMKVIQDDVKEEINKTIIDGLPNYLESSISEIRQMGMIVSKNLAFLINDTNLELPIEDNQFTKNLLSLLEFDDIELKPNREEKLSDVPEQTKEQIKKKELLDSDDDDDLQLLPTVSKKTGPLYLAQCIDGLSSYEDHKFMEECLKSCNNVIQKHQYFDELDVELCKRLLLLEDRFSIENFQYLRNSAIIMLIVKSPEAIAKFLTEQFYERNYSICQRLEILDIVVKGAQKLSLPDSCIECKEDDKSLSKETFVITDDWQKVVQKRIDSKTKRFAKDKSKIKPQEYINRFSNCAGWFFYPLLSNFDSKEYLDMQGTDHLLLETLLNSLATVVYCSINIPTAGNMAKSMLQFCMCFRMHVETGVRKAVLHAVCTSIMALDAGHSLPDMSRELCDLHSWLNVAALRDPDSHCSQLAQQILSLLNSLSTKLLLN